MTKCTILAEITDGFNTWKENFITEDISNEHQAKDYVQYIVDKYNESLRWNELPRHLVRIIDIKEVHQLYTN